jgi:8-oxo-dGTP pyrophosphatase MutT (NUDIX family)
MHNFIENIRYLLNKPLPGPDIQLKMAPESRKLFPSSAEKPCESAVLVLFFCHKGQIKFPLIRRPLYNGHHSGQMAFPGGKMDCNDAGLKETALRETHEEIGICPADIEILGHLTELFIPVSNMLVTPYVGYCPNIPRFIKNVNEVDELFQITLNDLLNQSFKKIEKWPFMGKEWDVPFYLFEGQKVWGATAMILSELEEIARNCSLV